MTMMFDEALRAGAALAPPREPAYSRTGIAASAHPLPSQTALAVLRAGGNAVDAAIAAAAILMVVEPRNGHPGGDAFLLIDPGDGKLTAINGSGAAPAAATLARYRALGGIPHGGLRSATVPGVISAWLEAHERFGTIAIAELLEPAIAAAAEGVVVTPRFHTLLTNDAPIYARYPSSARVFLPDGTPPAAGSVFAQPLLARTFERLAAHGLADFYLGSLGNDLIAFSEANGGLLTRDDLAAQRAETRDPVTIRYRGYEIVEQPPVSQGIVVLLALRILERFDLAAHAHGSPERLHLLIEALGLAYDERLRRLGDPRFVAFDEAAFLSDDLADRLAQQVDLARTLGGLAPVQVQPDTTFAAFAAGPMTVAYIQSLYSGSGVVMGETGILMNSRLLGFSLDEDSPNALAPGKRPVHTLNAWMIRRAGTTLFAGGTPGAQWQVQTNLQIITNLVDYGMDVIEAQAAPRFTIGNQLDDPDGSVKIESRAGAAAIDGLRKRGHPVEVIGPWDAGSAVQLVARDARTGVLRGATELRRPGCTVLGL